MTLLNNLDLNQEKALRCNSNMLITGGPGAGKTTIAIVKAKKETETIKGHQNILFLSFSNSAINQIKQVAGINLKKEEKEKISIQTFHSFFLTILRSYGKLLGIKKPIKILPPEEESILELKNNIDKKKKNSFFKKKALVEGKIAFDLFAELVLDILKKSSELLSIIQYSYPLLIIDEFQDTDTFQWEIIKKIGDGSKIICLADPYQRIYDFREGVTPKRISHFKQYFPHIPIDLGNRNYRSKNNNILKTANCIIENKPFLECENIIFEEYEFPSQLSIRLKYAVDDMKKLISEYGIENPKICIMTKTNKTAKKLSECLYKKTKKANFALKHKLILDDNNLFHFQCFLCSLIEAKTETFSTDLLNILVQLSNFHYSLKTKKSSRNAEKLNQNMNDIKVNIKNKKKEIKIIDVLEILVKQKEKAYTGIFFEDILKTRSLIEEFRNNSYLGPIVTLCDHDIIELFDIKIAKQAEDLYSKKNNYSGLSKLFEKHFIYKRINGLHHFMPNVVIMTMHKSKGKEYDGVIIYNGPYQDTLILRDDDNNYSRTRTLIRVAMSRARYYVTIFYKKDSPPFFLKTG